MSSAGETSAGYLERSSFYLCVYLLKPQLHASNHVVVRTETECVANLECCSTRHLFHLGSEECLLGEFSASVLAGEGMGGFLPVAGVSPHVVAGCG